ncbi:MAG: ABC transporter ATP-binding protein [Clostridia bacterium]|nr:ABC transporter ATP-binding protein [Clostridia bacterium]
MKQPKDKKDKKKKEKKVSLKRTWQNNLFALREIGKASPFYLIVYLSSTVIYGLLEFFTGAYLLRKIVNSVEVGEELSGIVMYVAVLMAVTVVSYLVLNWFWHVISPKMQQKIAMQIQKELFAKASEVELGCYENPAFYDKYVRAMDEASYRVSQVLDTLDTLLSHIITTSANSFLLFFIDPWLMVFACIPLFLGFIKKKESKISHDWSVARKSTERRVWYVQRTFYLSDYAKEMRIGGMYRLMLRDLRESYRVFRDLTNKYGLKVTLLSTLRHFGLDVLTVFGATLYAVWSTMYLGPANGGMSVGDCVVVIGSISTVSYSLNYIVDTLTQFHEHALFLEDVRYFLDYQPTIVGGERIASEDGGELRVEHVSFRYDGAEKDTLEDISFTLKKGERLALVGSNGSGKTTLVKLLLRLYDPKEGEILLNGVNIKEMTLDSYRDRFGTVFQDFKLFSLSVRENVLLREPREGDEELVIRALKESGAYERVMRLPKGLDTVLTREFDDEGANLSVGEQQKLSLARVFAENTPFVILDEPSSALDPIAEYTMFENMMRATEGRSVIFISHRLSSAVLADRVILMDEGKIAEIGTHEELLARGGKYAEMFSRQAENYLGSEVTDNE